MQDYCWPIKFVFIENVKEISPLSPSAARVKSAILKKDEMVNNLRKQYEAAVKRADHLESLLDQQRKQLLDK